MAVVADMTDGRYQGPERRGGGQNGGRDDMLDRRLRAMEERFERKLETAFTHVGDKVESIKTLPAPAALAAVVSVPDRLSVNTKATVINAVIGALSIVAVAVIGLYQLPKQEKDLEQIHSLVNSEAEVMRAKIERLEAKIELLGGPPAPPTRLENAQP